MLVSFIIPSYNSEQTINRCLDSIFALPLKQTEFEVIFIDDCSADNTCEVVEAYQIHYSNITLLKQSKNNRQGAARNRGVNIARGKYICFVDSDDIVRDGVVSAIRSAHKQQIDMTAFHYCYANEYGVITKENEHLCFSQKQLFTGLELQNIHPYWCSAPWAYIYRKDFLDDVNYPFYEGVLYEDSDFVANHLYYAQKMAYSPELGYIAYYREGSTTHSNSYKNLADYLLLGSRMIKLYSNVCQDMESCKRKDDGIQKFADGILEGACFNIAKSIRRLYKLTSIAEIIAYYYRVDTHIDRNSLARDKRLYLFPEYFSVWVRLCIKHKYISIGLNYCLSLMHRLYLKLLTFGRRIWI